MGIFYDRVPAEEARSPRAVIADALQTDPKAVQNVDAEAKKRAKEEGRTVSDLAREAVTRYVES